MIREEWETNLRCGVKIVNFSAKIKKKSQMQIIFLDIFSFNKSVIVSTHWSRNHLNFYICNSSNICKNTFRHHGIVHYSPQKSAVLCPLIALKIHTSLLGLDIEMRGIRVPKKMRSGHGDQNCENHLKKGLRRKKKVGPLKT